MTCPTCGIDIAQMQRATRDPWPNNRRRATQALCRHALQCEETDEVLQLLINAGEAKRQWARRNALPPELAVFFRHYDVAHLEFSQN